ncbi:MAG: hypothetical protein HZB83_05675 [Deltaproteobacteria bacterium]|nr:hypothetical protein [Deltaproteobacteria bacterium]
MGLIQRVLDIAGVSTISITLAKEITAVVKPSRALFLRHPFGLTLGDIGDKTTQEAVLKDCLRYAGEDLPSGVIVDLPYVWTKDDLRERQLRKEAR